jgi:hypothetical protein
LDDEEKRRGPGVTPGNWQLSDLQEIHEYSELNPSKNEFGWSSARGET